MKCGFRPRRRGRSVGRYRALVRCHWRRTPAGRSTTGGIRPCSAVAARSAAPGRSEQSAPWPCRPSGRSTAKASRPKLPREWPKRRMTAASRDPSRWNGPWGFETAGGGRCIAHSHARLVTAFLNSPQALSTTLALTPPRCSPPVGRSRAGGGMSRSAAVDCRCTARRPRGAQRALRRLADEAPRDARDRPTTCPASPE